MPTTAPTAKRLFHRVSGGQDSFDRDKVTKYLKDLGLGSGLLGGQKVKKGVDWFMTTFDTAPEDGKVTWNEFVKNGRHLVPPGVTTAGGKLNPQLVGTVFDDIAGAGKTSATAAEVAAYVEPKVTGAAAMFAGSIADAAARLTVDALDADGDGKFSRTDLEALVADLNTQLGEP